MELIPFTSKDLIPFVEMSSELHRSPHVETPLDKNIFISTFRACLAGNQNIEGRRIVESDQTLGYLLLAHSFSSRYGSPIILLEELYLIPEARNQHIGRAILEALGRYYSHQTGVLKLECPPENAIALQLFRSLGFQPQPHTVMVWELPS